MTDPRKIVFDTAKQLGARFDNAADVAALNHAIDHLLGIKHVCKLANPSSFFAAVREAFGRLEQSQVDGLNALLEAMGVARWPIAWTAYGLATAWHETAATMQPIKERGGDAYLQRMYDINGHRPGKARELGNVQPGDGVKFAGRGHVQLTGRTNYDKASEVLGLDLVADPDRALCCEVSCRILVWGMETGAFTGRRLADYLPLSGKAGHDAYGRARRIINGNDRADVIAKHALAFEAALQAGEWA